ncbi:unnamed protein product [Symbiodinium sp. CCMP2592]|nr:unnamed protein product [Symbiodinium sp. CCMP2592]
MPPKTPAREKQGKGGGKSGKAEGPLPSTSQVQLGFPAEVITALQSLRDRATSDLRLDDYTVAEDRTLIQAANQQAAAITRATKRLEANSRAKVALGQVLGLWLDRVGRHLAAVPRQINNVGARLDADIQDATAALDAASQGLVAGQAALLRQQAAEAMGPPIATMVGNEVLRIAAELRAAATVSAGSSAILPMSGGHFGFPDNTGAGPADLHATMDLGYGGVGNLVEDALIEPTTRSHVPPGNPAAASGRRWALKRATDPAASRPSKSPRRSDPLSDNVGTAEGSATPWPSAATGRSPLGHKPTPLSRPGDLKTQLDASADPSMPNPPEPTGTPGAAPVPVELKDSAQGELDWVETQRSWLQSWIAVVQRLAAQGRDLVGDVPQPPDQAALPGRPATDAEISSFHGIAEAIWKTLLEHAQDPDSVTGPRILNMVQDVQHLGGMVHSQPVLVISCRQGVIALAHLLNSRILGLDGFAPQTLQEWANPHEVLGRGLTPHGHLATAKTDDEAEAVLLDQDCPFF